MRLPLKSLCNIFWRLKPRLPSKFIRFHPILLQGVSPFQVPSKWMLAHLPYFPSLPVGWRLFSFTASHACHASAPPGHSLAPELQSSSSSGSAGMLGFLPEQQRCWHVLCGVAALWLWPTEVSAPLLPWNVQKQRGFKFLFQGPWVCTQ